MSLSFSELFVLGFEFNLKNLPRIKINKSLPDQMKFDPDTGESNWKDFSIYDYTTHIDDDNEGELFDLLKDNKFNKYRLIEAFDCSKNPILLISDKFNEIDFNPVKTSFPRFEGKVDFVEMAIRKEIFLKVQECYEEMVNDLKCEDFFRDPKMLFVSWAS